MRRCLLTVTLFAVFLFTACDSESAPTYTVPLTIPSTNAFDICVDDVYRYWGTTRAEESKENADSAAEFCGDSETMFQFQRGSRIQNRNGDWVMVSVDGSILKVFN